MTTPICSNCGHDGDDHRPEDPDEPWACRIIACPCEQVTVEQPAVIALPTYGPQDSQVMTPDQVPEGDEVDRAHKAQELLVAGHSWRQIAEMTGYANAESAKLSVRAMRQRAALSLDADQRNEILQLEMQRLEQIIKAFWPMTMAGSDKAAAVVLKTIAQQARMYGLEELHTKAVQSSKTIIIAGTPEEYAAALRQVAQNS
jgi:hypothetical protein